MSFNKRQTNVQSGESRTLKFILIGDAGVGKTCIARYLSNEELVNPNNTHPSTISPADVMGITVMINGIHFKVQLWDTAGQDRFRAVTTNHYRNANGVIIVYDITDRDSFEHIESSHYKDGNQILSWWDELQKAVPLREIEVITFLGNKIDIKDKYKRKIPTETGQSIVDYLTDVPEARGKVIFREVSAVTGEGLEGLLAEMVSKAAGCDPNGVAREVEVAAQENRAFVLQNQKESTGGYKCPC